LLPLLLPVLLVACRDRSDDEVAVPAASEPQSTRLSPEPSTVEAETARINDWFEARWEEQLDFSPI
jgi:hypothetical protein